MFMKKKILFTLSVLTVMLPIANTQVFAGQKKSDQDNAAINAKDLHRLEIVMAEVKKYYVKKVDSQVLFNNAISGMLSGLDPHSEYLKKEDLDDLETLTFGKFGGIGIEVIPDQGALRVISPIDDTPAAKGGIKPGDIIAEINGKFVKNMTLRDAINLMRGPKGSKVNLIIVRKGQSKPLNIQLTRDVIKVNAIKSRMLEPGYGYVRVAFFQESTESDLAKAINKLKKESGGALRGLVLDLRNNPGGLFDAAVKVADDFLDASKLKNNVIVYTKGNNKDAQVIAKATSGELLPNVPIVVLINDGSASAAEIVAGALKDQKRAIVLGTKSFGKGSVQTLLPVDSESAIKLTTALYYTPSGKSIQAKGIEPDISVSDIVISAKNVTNTGDSASLSEASLLDHLDAADTDNADEAKDKKDGGEKNDDADDNSSDKETLSQVTNDDNKMNKNMKKLFYKDYQLYEALNVLKALTTMHK